MKKIFSYILLILISVSNLLPLSAAAEEGNNDAVIDIPAILSESEYYELSAKIDAVSKKYGIDIAFVISDEIGAASAQDEADDIYDYCGYGIGENRDGILYFVCETTHEYAFSTCGKGIEVFNDDGLEYIDESMLPYLREGDYYGAALVYADKCEELMEMAANGQPYKKKINIVYVIGGIILIPFALAFGLTAHKLSKTDTAVMQSGAGEYMTPGSMNMKYTNDIFLYSTVTKKEKPKDSSTHSSTHTSSSGTTHGGRSGSF